MAECGFVFHACLPPKISAYCRGVTPMSRLKKREKWLWSAKPVWSATSIIGTFRLKQFPCFGDADGFEIPVREMPLLGERTQEVILAQPRDLSEPIQRNRLARVLLKVGAYGPDVGFVLVRIGQGCFSGVIAQKLPQKHQKDFFLPELLVFLNDHGVQVAQRTRQFVSGSDVFPETAAGWPAP